MTAQCTKTPCLCCICCIRPSERGTYITDDDPCCEGCHAEMADPDWPGYHCGDLDTPALPMPPMQETEPVETAQPQGLGDQKGEKDGKQSGVHPGRTRQGAEGPDGRGVHTGSGVLDRSGSDPPRGRPEGAGRRGLSEPTPAAVHAAGVGPPMRETETSEPEESA